MQVVKLIINGESVELPNDITIPVNLQSQDIGNMSEKLGSFSRSFVVKATAKNREIVDNAFTFQNDTTFPYRKASAIVIVNGIQLAEGNVVVENDGIGIDEIRLTFYTGNSTFFQLIANKQLRSLCYKTAQHFYWTQLVFESRLQSENYLYPIIAYRNNATDISESGASEVYCNRLLPALKLSYILDTIANEFGYTIDNSLSADQLFSRVVFPYSNGKFQRDNYYEKRNNWLSKYTPTQAINLLGTPDITDPTCPWVKLRISEQDVDGYPINFDADTCARYSCVNPQNDFIASPDNIRVRYTIKFHVELNPDADIFLSLQDNNIIKTNWLYNATSFTINPTNNVSYVGEESNLVEGVWSLGGNNDITATQDFYEVTFITESDIEPHRNLALKIWADTEFIISELSIRSEYILDNGTTDENKVVLVDKYYTDEKWTNSIVSPSMCLPDISVSVFLKTILQMFGLFLIVDESSKTIKLRVLKDILYNLGSAKDWSDKITEYNQSYWNTRPIGFGQISSFEYSNEEPNDDEYGSYKLIVDDDTLESEKDIVKLPYSATTHLYKFIDLKVAYIQRIDALGVVNASGSTKQHVLLIDNVPADKMPLTYYYFDGANNQTYAENDNENTLYGLFGYSPQLGLSFTSLCSLYYDDIFNYIKKYKELTVYALLTPVDIQSINFEIPVYIRQFNSYFYIQKIQDWLPNKPCKVQLLKLQ